MQNEDDIMQICTLTETEIAVIKWYQPLSGLYKLHNNSQERYFAYIIERKETVEEKFNVFYSNHVVVVGLDKYITSSEYVCALLWYAIYPTRIVNMQVSIHCQFSKYSADMLELRTHLTIRDFSKKQLALNKLYSLNDKTIFWQGGRGMI